MHSVSVVGWPLGSFLPETQSQNADLQVISHKQDRLHFAKGLMLK